ncbi:unnamed protein product [Zymoseptoria tritici ST99CH_3D7]|uniref:Uncharacterized protein n=1 Tax=Zymoseptoria tritici (strain ST99CH_3D7) TaxID=1276538 RepID=A0A1X7RG03_ZYMT9|nr:unnamed protein product [Zymoseptoria tritici ST99CH_3D7]
MVDAIHRRTACTKTGGATALPVVVQMLEYASHKSGAVGLPLPASSRTSSERRVARFNAMEICWRSIMNELCIRETLSLVAIRVKILSVRPIRAASAGTKQPMWAM